MPVRGILETTREAEERQINVGLRNWQYFEKKGSNVVSVEEIDREKRGRTF